MTDKSEKERRGTCPGEDVGGETGDGACAEDLPTTLERVEREMIVVALKASRGNRARAARALGISERLIGLRVQKYAIDARKFRTKK